MDEKTIVEKIDTSKPIHLRLDSLRSSIINLQVKVNELVDIINEQLIPDDDFNYDEEDDENEKDIVIEPNDLKISKRKPKKMN